MEQFRGNSLIYNKNIISTTNLPPTYSDAEISIYEVLRVENGIPLFLNDHLRRLYQSAQKTAINISQLHDDLFVKGILELIQETQYTEGNIKILLTRKKNDTSLFIYFIPHYFPNADDYQSGVDVKLFSGERSNPNAKTDRTQLRNDVNVFIKEKQLYEALLINNEGFITEGSRSNVFFIDHSDTIITAPDNLVLKGITRKYAIEICNKLNIPIHYSCIASDSLHTIKAAFLSGTSPKIMPIRSINNYLLNVKNDMITLISLEYENIISANKRTFKQKYR